MDEEARNQFEASIPIINEIFDQLKLVANEILQACRADRQRIIILKNRIDGWCSDGN